mmetsp:Transcript_627/g.759  ORF Transcript_627/g.759 Transcript_627/m.759 type:complete len:300 (+) Transcript_627:171-1070(+)
MKRECDHCTSNVSKSLYDLPPASMSISLSLPPSLSLSASIISISIVPISISIVSISIPLSVVSFPISLPLISSLPIPLPFISSAPISMRFSCILSSPVIIPKSLSFSKIVSVTISATVTASCILPVWNNIHVPIRAVHVAGLWFIYTPIRVLVKIAHPTPRRWRPTWSSHVHMPMGPSNVHMLTWPSHIVKHMRRRWPSWRSTVVKHMRLRRPTRTSRPLISHLFASSYVLFMQSLNLFDNFPCDCHCGFEFLGFFCAENQFYWTNDLFLVTIVIRTLYTNSTSCFVSYSFNIYSLFSN